MISRRSILTGAAAGATLVLAGCGPASADRSNDSPSPQVDAHRHQVAPQAPVADVVVPAGPEGAVIASRAVLGAATAVVVFDPNGPTPAPTSEASPTTGATGSAAPSPSAARPGPAVAEAVARALGVPLFQNGPGLVTELDRLQTRTVIGYPAEGLAVGQREVLAGPASPEVLPPLDGLPARPPASGVLALGLGDVSAPVAVTLAAAGIHISPVSHPHPGANRTSTAAVRSASGPVLGVGPFGSTEWFAAAVALTRSAAELPGGGILPFPARRMVALYGHPQTPSLGMLGEQPPAQAVDRLKKLVAEYQALLPGEQVIGSFEIIATVASGSPTADGDYSSETAIEVIKPWIEAAEANGIYVMLDLQPGRTDFLTQAKRYEELLRRPWVGLALDPEWRLKPDGRHLVSIGQVGVDEVNAVGTWLADLVKAHGLPPKVLTLHQFQTRMVVDRQRLDTSRDEIQYLVHVDGQGGQAAKQATWEVIRRDLPARTWWGWKNFVDEDKPMLTPAQTVAQVKPTPYFISYQ